MTQDVLLTKEEEYRALERFVSSREEARKVIRELLDRGAVQELVQIVVAARYFLTAKRMIKRMTRMFSKLLHPFHG
jgi:hypothetical protein